MKIGTWIEFGCDHNIEKIEINEERYILAGHFNLHKPSALWDTIKVWTPDKGESVLVWQNADLEPNGVPRYSIRTFDETSETNGFHFTGDDENSEHWDNIAPLKFVDTL